MARRTSAIGEPTLVRLLTGPDYTSRKEVWHCIFCGHHWEGGPPTITARIVDKDHVLKCCPYCHEYKGLEVCDVETCDCWFIACVPDMMSILRTFAECVNEGAELTDQKLASITALLLHALAPPKEKYGPHRGGN